jgi:hypothetical protein
VEADVIGRAIDIALRVLIQWMGLTIRSGARRAFTVMIRPHLCLDILQPHRQLADALASRVEDSIAVGRVGSDVRQFADPLYLCVPKIRFGVDAASGRRKLAS